jgi:hyperosmotically inducible periplasmic protein
LNDEPYNVVPRYGLFLTLHRIHINILLRKITMKYARAIAFAALAGITVIGSGCAVGRGQSTAGAYVDDTAITTAVKAKMAEDKTVAATSISVETLNGTVQLSGFAKSAAEKAQAESIARNTKNVKSVRNDIVVRN